MINIDTRDLRILEHLDSARRMLTNRHDHSNADETASIFIHVARDILGNDDAHRLAGALADTDHSVAACIDKLNAAPRIHLAVRDHAGCTCATAGVDLVRAFTDEDAAYEFSTNTDEGKGTYLVHVDYEPAQPNLPAGFGMERAIAVTHNALSPGLPDLSIVDVAAVYPAFIAAAQANAERRS